MEELNKQTNPETNENSIPEESLVRQMEGPEKGVRGPILIILLVMVVISAGLASGFFLNKMRASSKQEGTPSAGGTLVSDKGEVKKGKSYGVEDREIYPDLAEGILVVNDKSFTDEGSHVLIRDQDDPTQNAYLTSTVLDLNLFVDRKVEVWGETFAAQKAGWLMDVGTVKVLE